MKKVISAIAAALLIGGCATNPETGNFEITRTGVGVAGGAIGGALLGAALGDGGTAIQGAIVGAAAGGAAGHYWEKRYNAIQHNLQGTSLKVEKRADQNGNGVVVVKAPADAHFRVGSPHMLHDSFEGMNYLAGELKKTRHRVYITGHTDATGPQELNDRLSLQRARAVADYLVAAGVNPERLYVRGAGSEMPIADNSTMMGRAANRRVEIELTDTI